MRLFFVATLAFALAAAPAVFADQIRCKSNRTIDDIEVVEETATGVSYKIHGSLQQEPAENVVEVVYEKKPIGWEEAERAFKRGDYARCTKDFEQRLNDRQPWVRQYSTFYLAESRRLTGDLAGAAEMYQKFVAEFGNHRFYPKAKLGIGLVKLEQRDFLGAQKVFEDLAAEAKSKKLQDVQDQANFQLAATLEAQGKAKEALDRYQRIATAAAQRGVTGLAHVAVLRLQAQTEPSKADAAISGLYALIEGQDQKRPDQALDFDLLAASYTALGDIYFDAKGDAQKALLCYLRVVVDPELSKVSGERPHALWGAARAFEKAKSQDWKERAESLRRELRDQYPNSIWAKK
jgi:hypothetical protein